MATVQLNSVYVNERRVEYYRVHGEKFSLQRLKLEPNATAGEYCDFYHIPTNEPYTVYSTHEFHPNEALGPSLCGQIQFTSMRNAICYWSNMSALISNRWNRSEKIRIETAMADIEAAMAERLTFRARSDKFAKTEYDRGNSCVVGDLGHLSQASAQHPDAFVLASGHSLITPNECKMPFQCIRDPIGFRCDRQVVTSLPVYDRPVFIQKCNGVCDVVRLHVSEFAIKINALDRFFSDDGRSVRVFNQKDGREANLSSDKWIFLYISEQRVVAVSDYFNPPIPNCGALLAIRRDQLSSGDLLKIRANTSLSFECGSLEDVSDGIQCGPSLIRDGVVVYNEENFGAEDFRPDQSDFDVVPSTIHESSGGNRAARTAIGCDRHGSLMAVVVEGTPSSASLKRDGNPIGATFAELAEICRMEGFYKAMCLDSGGSVGLFRDGKSLIRCGDIRHGRTFRQERPLAHATILR